jgi:hypothetical protein
VTDRTLDAQARLMEALRKVEEAQHDLRGALAKVREFHVDLYEVRYALTEKAERALAEVRR